MQEIAAAVEAAQGAGCTDLIVLSCTASYPAPPEQTNLRRIPVLAETFEVPIGLSDHTLGIGVPIAGVAFGACLIEKHVTLDRARRRRRLGLLAGARPRSRPWSSSRSGPGRRWAPRRIGPTEAEKEGLRFRRSLYVVADVRGGRRRCRRRTFARSVPPAASRPTRSARSWAGRSAMDAAKGTPLTWDLI